MQRVQNITDCPFNLFNLQPKNLRRNSRSAASEDYELLGAVGGCDADAVFGAQFVRGFLDKHIGGLGFFGVNDGDISIFFHFPVAFHPVRVKNENKVAPPKSLLITQNVD